KRILSATSNGAPALASNAERLLLAWTGPGDGRLNVAPITLSASGSGIEDIANAVVLSDTSSDAPALASHDGRLFLAWKGLDDNRLNVMFSDDGGRTFKGKRIVSATSDRAPALASHGGLGISTSARRAAVARP